MGNSRKFLLSAPKVATVAHERFQLKGFDWENFGIGENWPLMGGGRTVRFDCIYAVSVPSSHQSM